MRGPTQTQLASYVLGPVVGGFIVNVASDTWTDHMWAWGTAGAVLTLLVFLIPRDGPLRRERYGRARGVRALAVLLVAAYPFMMVWLAGSVKGLVAVVVPVMMLAIASGLLLWSSTSVHAAFVGLFVGMVGASTCFFHLGWLAITVDNRLTAAGVQWLLLGVATALLLSLGFLLVGLSFFLEGWTLAWVGWLLVGVALLLLGMIWLFLLRSLVAVPVLLGGAGVLLVARGVLLKRSKLIGVGWMMFGAALALVGVGYLLGGSTLTGVWYVLGGVVGVLGGVAVLLESSTLIGVSILLSGVYVLLDGVEEFLEGWTLTGVAFSLLGVAALLIGMAVLGDWSSYGARLWQWLIAQPGKEQPGKEQERRDQSSDLDAAASVAEPPREDVRSTEPGHDTQVRPRTDRAAP